MKNYAKVGGKRGKPAYRTPSTFRYKSSLKAAKSKTGLAGPHTKQSYGVGAVKWQKKK